MGEELKQTYTVRIPEQVAAHLEQAARNHGITPTALIQSIVIRKFKARDTADRGTEISADTAVAAKLETLRTRIETLEQSDTARSDQLRFEIIKTRSALLHSLDQTLSADVVDKIIEASDKTARDYVAGLAPAQEHKS